MTGSRVIVGVSQSLAGLAAIRHAVGEARRRGTTLQAVRVWPYPPTTRSGSFLRWEIELTDTTRHYVSDAFEAAPGGVPGDIDVHVAVPYGRPASVLKDTVRHAGDLLVVGAPASPWRPGPVVRGCTRAAVCPVIVVPAPELAREWRLVPMRRIVSALIHGRR